MRAYRRSPLYPNWGHRFAALLARMPGNRGTTVKEVGGVRYELDLSQVIDSSLYFSGTFEADTEAAITSHLRAGMTAVDVGANFGYHTFRMAQGVGPTGTVLAVEPMSGARTKLARNMALNQFENIRVSAVGLADSDLGEQDVAFVSSYRLDGRPEQIVERVRITTLDALAQDERLDRVDFVKIDVDGYEGKVLRGARTVLERWRPVLVFEISPGAMAAVGDRAEELVANLTSLGYEIRHEDGEKIADLEKMLARVGDHSINLVAEAIRPD